MQLTVLVDSVPRQLGIIEILSEWIKFRMNCLSRELTFDLDKRRKNAILLGLPKSCLTSTRP